MVTQAAGVGKTTPSNVAVAKKKLKVPLSKSRRADLVFPVGRIRRHLKAGRYAKRIGTGAPIFLAAVLEYLVAEVLHLACGKADDQNRSRITPRHVTLAIRDDEELRLFLGPVIIASGGVPHTNAHDILSSMPPTKPRKPKAPVAVKPPAPAAVAKPPSPAAQKPPAAVPKPAAAPAPAAPAAPAVAAAAAAAAPAAPAAAAAAAAAASNDASGDEDEGSDDGESSEKEEEGLPVAKTTIPAESQDF